MFISLFGAGKSILLTKKIIPAITNKNNENFISKPRRFFWNLFFYKLHIILINFKLRHICVFNTETYEFKRKSSFLGMMGSGKSSIGLIVSKKLNLNFLMLTLK